MATIKPIITGKKFRRASSNGSTLQIAAASQADVVMGTNSAIREATIFLFIGNELLSLLENAGRMGIPLPSALTNAFEILD